MKRILNRGPIWLLIAGAAWNLAIFIAAATALVLGGNWDYAEFAVDRLFWAFSLGYVAFLMHENDRLRQTPLWRAADEAWQRGYAAGVKAHRYEFIRDNKKDGAA